jgi:hypothetical protein
MLKSIFRQKTTQNRCASATFQLDAKKSQRFHPRHSQPNEELLCEPGRPRPGRWGPCNQEMMKQPLGKTEKPRNFPERIITCYNQPVEEDHFLGFGRFSFVSKPVCFSWGFVKVLLCFFCTLMHTQNEQWYALCIYIYTHTCYTYNYIYIWCIHTYQTIWNPLNFGPDRTLSWMVNPGFSLASETGTIGQPERDVDLYMI